MVEWLTRNSSAATRAVAAGDLVRWDEADEVGPVEGYCGLVRLGAAWGSPDVFGLIENALGREEDGALATLARLRREEIGSDRESLHPEVSDWWGAYARPYEREVEKIEEYYQEARAAADERHRSRTLYMLERMEAGEHPDTHPEFWSEWAEGELPPMPEGGIIRGGREAWLGRILWGVLGIAALAVVLVVWVTLSKLRRGYPQA